MKKGLLSILLIVMFALVLVACKPEDPSVPSDPTQTTPLTAITFSGISEEIQNIAFEAEFNVLAGITATGNNGVDYTAQITFLSTSSITNNLLDTTKTGNHAIRYEVKVGSLTAQKWRYLFVESPERPTDQLVVNGDFALGTVFWDDGANGLYIADGAAMTLSVEDGALKAEVVAGSNLWTPRFGQQNIPFEQGKAYEVSFKAKSSVAKTINVQVGELIPTAPWFVDFKPGQTEHKNLTTEWATYSFVFYMATNNPRGGILFELGRINNQSVDATVWFDDIMVTETVLGEDTIAPTISGVRATVNHVAGNAFNPLAGVTAFDNIDGDLTDDIDVVIYKVDGEVETEVDEVDTTKAGVFKIVYTVQDAAGNVATEESVVTVIFVIVNEYPGWRKFINDWEGSEAELVVADGVLTLNMTALNAIDAGWKIQVIQDAFALGWGEDNQGHMNLEFGKTYRVTFEAKASLAGNLVVAIGHAGGGWTPYHVETGLAVTTDMQTITFEFTLDDTTANYTVPAQFKIELGGLFAGQTTAQTFTLDNVKIEVKDGDNFIPTDLIFNGTMDEEVLDIYALPEWRYFVNFWEGTAGEIKGVNGELVFTISNIQAMTDNWKIQVIQDAFALGTGADNVGHMNLEAGKTYKVTFSARASLPGNVTLAIGHAGGGWTPYHVETVAITTDMATYTVTFTTDTAGVDYSVPAQFKLEMGLLFAGATTTQTFVLDNVKIELQEGENFVATDLIVNGQMNAPVPYPILEWRYFVNFWEGTAGSIIGLNNELIFTISNISAMTDNWKIQVIQDAFALGTGADNVGHMNLEAGKTYKVTFSARASQEGNITLAIGHAGGGWTPYHMETIAVTKEMAVYTVTFTTDTAGVDYSVPAQFKLEMGLLFAGQTTDQQFVLAGVKIELQDGENFVATDLIVNGNMNAPEPYVLGEWRSFVNFWEGTVGEIKGYAGELIYTISNISAMTDNWKIQVIQDAFALGTGADNVGHMNLEAGKTYKVTFSARASQAGDITLAIGHAGGGWTPYHVETIAITKEMTTYTVTFTTDAAGVDYSVPAQFKLEMGLLFAGQTEPQTFVLDNVKIEVQDGENFVATTLIVNGTMDYIPAP
jgi:hypothetical protein